MITVGRSIFRLGARAATKAEAIRAAGHVLVENGRVEAGYVESMLAREEIANTFLGNGIAVPHGMPRDRDLLLETGIAVLQLPEGVEWNPGEHVHLVIAIAARSDEHLEILGNLVRILDDDTTVRRLAQTDDENEISEVMMRRAEASGLNLPKLAAFPFGADVTLARDAGLHARPAAALVELAKRFAADVRIAYDGRVASGRSLVSLLKLGVPRGGLIRITARGREAAEAVAALESAVASGLAVDEEERRQLCHHWQPEDVRATVPGLSAASGLAIGPLHHVKRRSLVVEATAKDPDAEEQRLRHAIAAALVDLKRLQAEVSRHSGPAEAAIFGAHAGFLEDPTLFAQTLDLLRRGMSAGWAWQQVVAEQAREMETLGEPMLAARAVDLRDVGTRVLRRLAGVLDEGPELPPRPCILIADDLTPSDTARLDPSVVLGFCTALGGANSHTAILARSLDIPALVGAGPALLHQPEGTLAILDGTNGVLYVGPSEADVGAARELQSQLRSRRDEEHSRRFQPAVTRDGLAMRVTANVALVSEAAQAVEAGAEGVGLLRTEFLFLNRAEPPSEEEQFKAYREMIAALEGRPLTLRTLDIGGDKPAPYLDLPAEQNPALGMRGTRLALARPEIFEPQLRAAYRAAQHGPLKLMFPMVATLDELAAARDLAEASPARRRRRTRADRHHGRGASSRGARRPVRRRGGLLLHRIQRPGPIRVGDGSGTPVAELAGRRSASGRPENDRSDRESGADSREAGQRLWRNRRGSAGRGPSGRTWDRRAFGQHPKHSGHQVENPQAVAIEAQELARRAMQCRSASQVRQFVQDEPGCVG
jgi:phosphocarrier protein FPr